ncbi:MAG: hypothetical protein H7A51_15510 [Akkermansiaceae bacterium]|nr:hypothetical protein [Akkermansiaceae bacterium]
MKKAILIVCAAAVSAPVFAEKPTTFKAPKVYQPANDLFMKAYKLQKEQGSVKAIAELNRVAPDIFDNDQVPAFAQYDFYRYAYNAAFMGSGLNDPEWAGMLLEWIYNHSRENGEGYWYGKITLDLHRHYMSRARYNDARQLMTREVNQLGEGLGTDIEINRLPGKKPVLNNFPEFKDRKLTRGLIDPRNSQLFACLASQDLAEGKWRRALEQAHVARKKGAMGVRWYSSRPKVNASKISVDYSLDLWRWASLAMAHSYQFLDLQELALNEYREITKFKPKLGHHTHIVSSAVGEVAYYEFLKGKTPAAAAIQKINKQRKLLYDFTAYPTADDMDRLTRYKVDILFRSGSPDKAWELLDSLRNSEKTSPRSRFLADMAWCGHRLDAGMTDDIEPLLIKLLTTARQGGIKTDEIELYHIYARYLIATGRLDDALKIQRELIRLLESFDVFTRLPGAYRTLAEIYSAMGASTAAKNAASMATQALKNRKVPQAFSQRIKTMLARPLPKAATDQETNKNDVADIQPRRASVTPLHGMPARGLFTLTNPTQENINGTLSFTGNGVSAKTPGQSSLVKVVVAPTEEKTTSKVTLELAPGQVVFIDIEQARSAENQVTVEWAPTGGKTIEASWQAQPAEEGFSVAIVDAGEYLDNPFYLIPFYHLLQYRDSFPQAMDMRIVASQPTRIEVYDQHDRIVCVDATGDGDFSGSGDMTMQDFNRNRLPDLKLADSGNEQRFRAFIRPANEIPKEGITLSLQIREGGKWVKISEDRLLARD